MAKKQEKTTGRKPFNFGDSPLVKQTESTVTKGYEKIEKEEKQQGSGETMAQPQRPVVTITTPGATKRKEKEATQAMLVHCPVSLHARLSRLKADTFEQTGERMTLNDMAVQAIAFWLDKQEAR